EMVGIRVMNADGHVPYESAGGYDQTFPAEESDLCIGRDHCICTRVMSQQPQEAERPMNSPGGSFCCGDTAAFAGALPPASEPLYRSTCIRRGFASLAVIPIRYHDQVMGAIHLADHSPGVVAPEMVEFIESIAPLIGEAIRHFNADSELARYRDHLEELVRQRTAELEQAAVNLARSNHDLEQFAYVASHDLQEPLRAVTGFLGLLKERFAGQLDEKAHEYVAQAVDGAKRMQSLIAGLLTFSRVGHGARFQPTDLAEPLRIALGNLQGKIDECGAKITSGEMPTLVADPVQLTQLLQNLIGNALKFRAERTPEIHISAAAGKGEWLFSVRDNGIGIEPGCLERIFLIFQRVHVRGRYEGTGIGLAICKRIVERHGGRIWAESEFGTGSTFRFTLPDRAEP
ncbi:MAG: ATP-binding protein, partial [Phycisphaerae bacterium]|nr:ATP-binding protein [Phycisphaerae bacterium]